MQHSARLAGVPAAARAGAGDDVMHWCDQADHGRWLGFSTVCGWEVEALCSTRPRLRPRRARLDGGMRSMEAPRTRTNSLGESVRCSDAPAGGCCLFAPGPRCVLCQFVDSRRSGGRTQPLLGRAHAARRSLDHRTPCARAHAPSRHDDWLRRAAPAVSAAFDYGGEGSACKAVHGRCCHANDLPNGLSSTTAGRTGRASHLRR